MKKIFTFTVGVMLCAAASAQTVNIHKKDGSVLELPSKEVNFVEFDENPAGIVQNPCVVVEQENGDKTEYLLSTLPQIRYVDDVVILSTSSATLELPAENVAKVYLSESASTGVDGVKSDAVRFSFVDGGLVVSGLEQGSAVEVYAVDGSLLVSRKAGNAGKVSLPLPQSQHGTLIVKANGQTFKVIAK